MIYETINQTISSLDISTISEERKSLLLNLTEFIQQRKNNNEAITINFICTHNSRRSHLSQIWAQTLAAFYKVNNITCYSGGTEATALFPKVADTLENQGFKIQNLTQTQNPIYSIKFGKNSLPIIGFSKTFDDALGIMGFNKIEIFAICSRAMCKILFIFLILVFLSFHGSSSLIYLFVKKLILIIDFI